MGETLYEVITAAHDAAVAGAGAVPVAGEVAGAGAVSVAGEVSVAGAVSVAGCRIWAPPAQADGGLVEIDGETFYRIGDYDAMAPFLTSLVSDADHWLFISSGGGLTAGRRSPDHALFPYYTDDRIHDACADTGAVTVLRVRERAEDSDRVLWEPFSPRYPGAYRVSRSLAKSTVGNQLRFEEENRDLQLTFGYSWATSTRFGFVRRARLTNHADHPVTVELLDGLRNILPAGIGRAFQEHFSTLVDGYKHSELDVGTGLGLLRLSSIPTDRAEPSEALRTTTVWSCGLEPAARLLSTAQLDRFRLGLPVEQETEVRGARGAYLLGATVTVPPGATRHWLIVADVEQDAADVIRTRRLLASGADLTAAVLADVRSGTRALRATVAAADGVQATGDRCSAVRHFTNTLFNVARGGIPADGYAIGRDDFAGYLAGASPRAARRHQGLVAGLPERLARGDLIEAAEAAGDPELVRLAWEYLPLTFSRRHGDPSRPWNDFAIAVRDEQGRRILGYQGNWRDIFQNWEALAHSFPGYVESMVFKFVNSSTADGHNPYRLHREGFDWEVPNPDEPWAQVGYWGDHQVVYLSRLLEASARFHPGRLEELATRRLFTYAALPYRIRPYPELFEDPRHTIDFDPVLDAELRRRAAEQGAFLLDGDGEPLRVTLVEKLLVVVLARLGNYVPEAGIWLNTQRPEWNDANNALVGYGVSMVTLYHLRRYLAYCRRLFGRCGERVEISDEVAVLLRRISRALTAYRHLLAGPVGDGDRRRVLDALGTAASDYRAGLYARGLSGGCTPVAGAELVELCDVASSHIDHSIRANRRADGLYHAYHVLRFDPDGIAVRHLYEMLEGQVAVLSCGVLRADEAAGVLDALRASRLYRPDQNSYLLYPDRRLPAFLAKNAIPADGARGSRLLAELRRRGDHRIAVTDVEGGWHFNAAFGNAAKLGAALDALAGEEDLRDLVEADRGLLLDLYERVFDHQSFTGRSGTFYKYEGLGCIYWHMVSKLLLAIHEVLEAGADGDPAVVARIRAHYEAVRDGIGVHKPPAVHGAIPVEPYSHTPAHAGAQQPGMTGQVKEDILSRIGELGLSIVDGLIRFRPDLVRPAEFLAAPAVLRYVDARGVEREIALAAGTLGFTFCQVPVVVHRRGPAGIAVTTVDGSRAVSGDRADGGNGAVDGGRVGGGNHAAGGNRAGVGIRTALDSLWLDAATSAAIFDRTGRVERLDVHLPGTGDPAGA